LLGPNGELTPEQEEANREIIEARREAGTLYTEYYEEAGGEPGAVLPTGRNFCRKTPKSGPPEKSQRPRKSAAEFYAEFPQKMSACFSLEILNNLQN
jgi:hypothetical protein